MATLNASAALLVPESCSIAFKEWAGVCRALIDGRQSIILRKGGVSEIDGEFKPEHSAFWLFPTFSHEAVQGLRTPSVPVNPGMGYVEIEGFATVDRAERLERIEDALALADRHVWTEETVLSRYHYKRPGLWKLEVQVYRRDPPLRAALLPEYEGCRTWVTLSEALSTAGLTPTPRSSDHSESAFG